MDDQDLQVLAMFGTPFIDDNSDEWVVDGLIHNGLNCLLGQPERGKTTFVTSLCIALLLGYPWLGEATRFGADDRILFFCEDPSSARHIRDALRQMGVDGRVDLRVLRKWPSASASIDSVIKRGNFALVVIDSAFAAVGDVNDQARADAFLSVVQPLSVPVVVVHHEAKTASSSPVGVQRFAAAYRHTIRILKCTPTSDGLGLALAVSGNYVPGTRKITATVNRLNLRTEVEASMVETSRPMRRRPKIMPKDQKAKALAAMAVSQGLSAGMTPTDYATALLGGQRGQEDPDRQREVGSALGRASVSHQTVANTIRDHQAVFDAEIASGSCAA